MRSVRLVGSSLCVVVGCMQSMYGINPRTYIVVDDPTVATGVVIVIVFVYLLLSAPRKVFLRLFILRFGYSFMYFIWFGFWFIVP